MDKTPNRAQRAWGAAEDAPKRLSDTPQGPSRETWGEAHGHSGRPISWIMVCVILAGFVIGGIGLILGGTRIMAWIGAGMVVVGGIVAWATGIMEDYDTRQHSPHSW